MSNPVVNPPVVKRIETFIDSIGNTAFPANIISLSHTRFDLLNLDLTVVERMPTKDDPNYTIGIATGVKTPQPDSDEISGLGGYVGATLTDYLLIFYAFVKDQNRERGQAGHSVLAEIVEGILVDDHAFKAALGMLQATVLGRTKRMQRFYIRQTRYLANEVDGNHLFLSATEVIFETEKVQ